MSYECTILADSISKHGHRLTTFQVTFPRYILAEWNTHRVFSRSSASSRAIPVEKQLKRIEEDPFIPFYWGKNQKGMQADEELPAPDQRKAEAAWHLDAAAAAMRIAQYLLKLGVHKQVTNRLLEPFMWHTVVNTATEHDNFFGLRRHRDASPEFKRIADLMGEAYAASTPLYLNDGEWHLPFVRGHEIQLASGLEGPREIGWMVEGQFVPTKEIDWERWAQISVGRCARVSYLTHDGQRDLEADVKLAMERLLPSGHMAPLEHAARPMTDHELDLFRQRQYVWDAASKQWTWPGKWTHYLGNVQGFVQYRKLIPNEHDFSKISR